MQLEFGTLETAIKESWDQSTCYLSELWNPSRPSTGHCKVTSLLVQDYFSGDILFANVNGQDVWTHYWNQLPDKTSRDITFDQYALPISLLNIQIRSREQLMEDPNIQRTYPILKQRVQEYLNSHT
ncbi:MAG: hypothetical protein V1859_04575 [archaeon]